MAVLVVLAGVLAAACQTDDDAPVESVVAVQPPTPAVSGAATATASPEAPTATAAPDPTATASPVSEPTAVPTQPPAATPTAVPEPTATPDPAPAYLTAVRGIKGDSDLLTVRLVEVGFVPPSPTDEWSASIEGVAIELANLVDDWQKVDAPPAFSEFHGLYLDSLKGWLRVAQVNAHWPRVGPDLEQQLLVSEEHEETYDTTLEAVAVAQAAYESVLAE